MYCEKTIVLIRKEVDSARQEIAYIERKPGANVRVAYLEAVTKLNNLIEDYQNAICVLETFNRPKLLQEFDFKAKALKEDLDVAVSDLEGIEATLTNTRADIVEIQQELKSLNFMRDTIRTLYITPGYPQESPSGPRMNPPAGY